jgi:hypothetical protein
MLKGIIKKLFFVAFSTLPPYWDRKCTLIMKNKILLTLCLALLLAACRKSQEKNQAPTYAGTWELRATKGGNILPRTYPPGNGNLVVFSTASYTYSVGGTVETQGNFTVQTDNYSNILFAFSTGNFKSDNGILQGDTLKIKPLNPEIAASYYVKK